MVRLIFADARGLSLAHGVCQAVLDGDFERARDLAEEARRVVESAESLEGRGHLRAIK